jgi:cobalt transport protein ATP-binding subunit
MTHDHVHRHDGQGVHAHAHAHDHDRDREPRVPGDDRAVSDRWVEIEHLHYAYPDGFEALRGVDLRIGRGEKVAIVGPNGAGKSTLLLHLNGINRPRHGVVRIAGSEVDASTVRRIRAEVGVVFQDPDDQLFSPTVFDDVAFGPLHMGLAADVIHDRVESALKAVGMEGFERRLPHHLSLGQRKRVALATVLSMDPSVLVFDEPSAGLDPRGRRQLIDLLRSLTQTLIVATHDMRLASEVLPRTVIMDDGIVVADGPTVALLDDATLLERHGLEAG